MEEMSESEPPRLPEKGVGNMTGWWSLTSSRPLIKSIMVSCSRLCAVTSQSMKEANPNR
jgi:hypothetical protein